MRKLLLSAICGFVLTLFASCDTMEPMYVNTYHYYDYYNPNPLYRRLPPPPPPPRHVRAAHPPRTKHHATSHQGHQRIFRN